MSPSPLLDPRQVRRNFARAAAAYDGAAVLQREIAARMLERLDYIKADPARVLDLGCGTGASLTALSERYPKAQVLGADLSPAMLRIAHAKRRRLRWQLPFLRGGETALLAGDARYLPLRSATVGFAWSNLMLHWLDDPLAALREMHRVLEVGGLLMFSAFGPDTLKELRGSFTDGRAHAHRFVDMHDYGDMLVECGFADPVMDVEGVTLTYPTLDDLLRDLRHGGGACALSSRCRGLTGHAAWRAVRGAYAKLVRDGRFPATVEVIYGHAWKAPATKTADGRGIVRFDPKQRAR